MAHQQFILANKTVPLGFLINVARAFRVLMVHKIRDDRFQSLLAKGACTLVAPLAAAYVGLNAMPMLLAVGVSALGAYLFAALLWLEAGDILLEFALEDERFFELMTGCRALTIVEDRELSLPRLNLYENVLALQDDGERLNRLDGGQRKRFASAQRKASAVQRTNNSFPIDFTFRQTRPLVCTDVADRKIFSIHAEYGDGRVVEAFHTA
jgi:hypothetical protein